MEKVIVSDSPHIRGKRTTRGIMIDVIIALLPAAVMGCVYFGLDAFFTILISVAASVLTELVYCLCLKKKPLDIIKSFDLTSVVTGLLLAMCLPSSVPWYVPLLSAVFSIAVVKMLFGGTGKNIVNPAITGRVFAFIAFQSVMVSGWVAPSIAALDGSVTTGATQLTSMLGGNDRRLRLRRADALPLAVRSAQGQLSEFFQGSPKEGARRRKPIPRKILRSGNSQNAAQLAEYPNVSGLIGTIITHKLATLYELQTIYSYEDALDMYEVICVNNYNERQILKHQQKQPRGR